MQVDRGAIKFILSGANIMCPGLTSPGAKMTKVPAETVVVSLFLLLTFSVLISCCRIAYSHSTLACIVMLRISLIVNMQSHLV